MNLRVGSRPESLRIGSVFMRKKTGDSAELRKMSGWQETHRTVVHAWMCDHFGHVNVRYYAHLFDDAGFALWSRSGITRAVFERSGLHTVVARTETDLRIELLPGQVVFVRSRWVRWSTVPGRTWEPREDPSGLRFRA